MSRLQRIFVYGGLPMAVVMASAMIARAYDTSWIASGQPLSSAQLKADLDEVQSRLAALENRDCPAGYTVVAKPYIASNPDSVQCKNGNDYMVKVRHGADAFWIDQYEASLWSTPTGGTQLGIADGDAHAANFFRNGQWTTPMYALSISGVTPSRWLTWFQANEACGLAGKRLATGDEWLAAASGTPDPGSNDGNASGSHACNTWSTGPRAAGGGAGGCVSRWGAEDMIGNVWEWTAEWYAAPGAGGAGSTPTGLAADPATNWPSGYGGSATCTSGGGSCGDDATWNLNTWTYLAEGNAQVANLPAGTVRGGSWDFATGAGVFTMSLDSAPSRWDATLGFRCVRK